LLLTHLPVSYLADPTAVNDADIMNQEGNSEIEKAISCY
jgi:hypothetical protein